MKSGPNRNDGLLRPGALKILLTPGLLPAAFLAVTLNLLLPQDDME